MLGGDSTNVAGSYGPHRLSFGVNVRIRLCLTAVLACWRRVLCLDIFGIPASADALAWHLSSSCRVYAVARVLKTPSSSLLRLKNFHNSSLVFIHLLTSQVAFRVDRGYEPPSCAVPSREPLNARTDLIAVSYKKIICKKRLQQRNFPYGLPLKYSVRLLPA